VGRDDARDDERLRAFHFHAVNEKRVIQTMHLSSTMPVGLYEKALPPDWSWEERLAGTARAGYDFAEISIDESDERLGRLAWPASERAALRAAIAATGVPILTLCLSGHRKYPLGSRSAETRRQALDLLARSLEFSLDIGIQIVQIAGYDVFYEPSDELTAGHFLESLRQGAALAAQAGVMLGLENVDVPIAESVGKLMDFVNAIDSPWFQLYPDMGNLAAAGYHPPAEFPLAGGHLVAVHVKDAAPRVIRGIPFGEGIVPHSATFRSLAATGFWGLLTVEMWGQMDQAGDPFATARAARRLVDGWVAEACPIPTGGESINVG
jgi:L-ribulose-5-phosphate 3-epimerase